MDERTDQPATVGEAIRWISPTTADRNAVPPWPPDAFAVVMSMLMRTGAYTNVVDVWPPASAKNWTETVTEAGSRWRDCAMKGGPLPSVLQRWWDVIVAGGLMPLAKVRTQRRLWEALLHLSATADEACSGVGLWDPNPKYEPSEFELECINLLSPEDDSPATLCREIDTSRAVVLPKLHAPRSGLTIHSLSHHVTFIETSGVKTEWHRMLTAPPEYLNLLLLPWPRTVRRTDFRAAEGQLSNMPPNYGFFCYEPKRLSTPKLVEAVRQAVSRAIREVGRVDAVIFPELALGTGQTEKLAAATGIMVIAGEGAPSTGTKGGLGSNDALVAVPVGASVFASRQRKHHRWRLDRSQIEMYGLGKRLDPERQWWEHVGMRNRQLQFWSASGWLNFCVLLCEDLARPEPVAPVVRSVGPNLLISLLMDGPQLEQRWGARYATVLADDPGCSVLTLTSLGMARLSRPKGKRVSRSVALWKDQGGRAIEIELPPRRVGIVLNLTRDYVEEHTADGRSDGGSTAYLRLSTWRAV